MGSINHTIDIENAVIIDVEATPARTYDEVAAAQTVQDRARALRSKAEATSCRYSLWTGQFLGWLVYTKKIIPHIPVWEGGTIRFDSSIWQLCSSQLGNRSVNGYYRTFSTVLNSSESHDLRPRELLRQLNFQGSKSNEHTWQVPVTVMCVALFGRPIGDPVAR
jgi:hypothetical protein